MDGVCDGQLLEARPVVLPDRMIDQSLLIDGLLFLNVPTNILGAWASKYQVHLDLKIRLLASISRWRIRWNTVSVGSSDLGAYHTSIRDAPASRRLSRMPAHQHL